MIPLWLIALLIIVILWIIGRKIVVIPSISVTTDKDSYDRSETVQISGSLLDQASAGIPGKTVATAITPPVGDVYNLPDVVTGADGSFALSWDIPDDAVGGTYTVTVSALGISASKTFRPMMIQKVTVL